jgi:hypothetical protein
MNFKDIDDIKKGGFEGFHPIKKLGMNFQLIPNIRGVYLILNLDSQEPSYSAIGTGGHFKEKNPNVPIAILQSNWLYKTIVVYIGKAGAENSKATLRSRLGQYLKFGQGKDIGHWGGRFIWQLAAAQELVVCWRPLPESDPRTMESELINDFLTQYGRLPFANLVQ